DDILWIKRRLDAVADIAIGRHRLLHMKVVIIHRRAADGHAAWPRRPEPHRGFPKALTSPRGSSRKSNQRKLVRASERGANRNPVGIAVALDEIRVVERDPLSVCSA